MKSPFQILSILIVVTLSLSPLGLGSVKAEGENPLEEEVLKILKERGTIAPQGYDELSLQPLLLLQGQFRAFEANNPANNEFSMRTARLGLKGTIYRYYDFTLVGEFGKGQSDLLDGYMGFNYVPSVRLRVGQFKQSFSLDWYTSASSRDFIELPLPIGNLTPDRDIGVMLHGDIGKGFLNYGLSVCNGTGKNTSDTNDEKDVIARAVVTPFNTSKSAFLKGLHLGGGMTYGKQETARDEMRRKGKFQTAGETAFFQFEEDVFHNGGRTRYGAELAWIVGPFSLKGEWVRMDLDDLYVTEGGSKDDFSIDGTYVSLSYILTGESQPFKDGTYRMIPPSKALIPRKGPGEPSSFWPDMKPSPSTMISS